MEAILSLEGELKSEYLNNSSRALPFEIILHILSYLTNQKDLLNALQVNKL
jgi:hypothetical protein